MNFLQDVITYVRRIVKSPSNSLLTDNLIIDYINRFWIMDVDARMQLFDLKTKYQFQTQPGVDKYNMPLYSVQTEPGAQQIGMFPVYQGFDPTCFINGIQIPFQTQKNQFYNIWPNIVQNLGQIGVGNGTTGPYALQIPIIGSPAPPNPPLNSLTRGHIDIAGIIATGNNQDPPQASAGNFGKLLGVIPTTSIDSQVWITSIASDGSNIIATDSGMFLIGNVNYGLLMTPGAAPYGNLPLPGAYSTTSNTINYLTGQINITFPIAIPAGHNILAQCFYYQTGLPRAILYYNNTITLRTVPDQQYLVELDAYLSPAAFLNTGQAIPFAYMAEYIARGAARKILQDRMDLDSVALIEPEFLKQQCLINRRNIVQYTNERPATIYTQQADSINGYNGSGFGPY